MIRRGLTALAASLAILSQLAVASPMGAFDMWLSLDGQLREAKALGDTGPCLDSLINVIDNLKNASFQQEALSALENTGKLFNDIGYYQSCMQTGNLTYYLIRPYRTDLKVKFNFGVCAPKECTQEDIDILVAKNLINKMFLPHIANGTEHEAAEYTTAATVVSSAPIESNNYFEFKSLVAGFAAISVIISLASYLVNRKKKATDEKVIEGSESAMVSRLLSHIADSFNLVSNFKYLLTGKKNQANTLNFIKVICGALVIYSGEYIRRYYVGIHQDDKEALDRFKDSVGLNLIYFSVIAFDVLFFISGATNALALMAVLQEKSEKKGKLGVSDFVSFYCISIVRRFLRLAPIMYLANFFYYRVVPTQLSNPLQYMFSEEFSKTCPDTYALSFSFVANIIKGTQYCAGWTWYLQSDFQMFLVLPLLMILAYNQPFVGKMVSWFLISLSLVGTLVIFMMQNLTLVGPYSTSAQYQSFMDDYQAKPWGKLAFYLSGALIGQYLVENRKTRKGSLVNQKKTVVAETNVGSLLTKDLENEARNRFGKLGDGDQPIENLKEQLVPKAKARKYTTPVVDESSSDEDAKNLDLDDDSIDWSWLLTTIVSVACTGIVVGLFVGFMQFSKSKDSWSTFYQVLYSIGMRILIMLAISIVVLRMEYPLNRQSKKTNYTLLGVLTSFSLGIYLWHNVFTEWGISSMPVNQYYEPLLIVYYCLSTIVQCIPIIVLLTLFVELPARRLVSHSH